MAVSSTALISRTLAMQSLDSADLLKIDAALPIVNKTTAMLAESGHIGTILTNSPNPTRIYEEAKAALNRLNVAKPKAAGPANNLFTAADDDFKQYIKQLDDIQTTYQSSRQTLTSALKGLLTMVKDAISNKQSIADVLRSQPVQNTLKQLKTSNQAIKHQVEKVDASSKKTIKKFQAVTAGIYAELGTQLQDITTASRPEISG